MCFILYLGTTTVIERIPWNENDRGVNTNPLDDSDELLGRHLPNLRRAYVGLSAGCGCGFRYATRFSPEPIDDEEISPNDHEQRNHLQLHALLRKALTSEPSVQLYGCWDGDEAEPSDGNETIPLSRIIERGFFFRERFHYLVVRDEV